MQTLYGAFSCLLGLKNFFSSPNRFFYIEVEAWRGLQAAASRLVSMPVLNVTEIPDL